MRKSSKSFSWMGKIRNLFHHKIDHVANYILLLAMNDFNKSRSREANVPKLDAMKLDKMMYYIEGLSYLKLGYGISESVFQTSEYGALNPSIQNRFGMHGQNDLIWGVSIDYKERGLKKYPTFLLSADEKEFLKNSWERLKDVSVWEMIEWMKTDEAIQKAKENEKPFLFAYDIRAYFHKKDEEVKQKELLQRLTDLVEEGHSNN